MQQIVIVIDDSCDENETINCSMSEKTQELDDLDQNESIEFINSEMKNNQFTNKKQPILTQLQTDYNETSQKDQIGKPQKRKHKKQNQKLNNSKISYQNEQDYPKNQQQLTDQDGQIIQQLVKKEKKQQKKVSKKTKIQQENLDHNLSKYDPQIPENNAQLQQAQDQIIKPKRKYNKKVKNSDFILEKKEPHKKLNEKRKYIGLNNNNDDDDDHLQTQELDSDTLEMQEIEIENEKEPKLIKKIKGIDGPFEFEGFSWKEKPEKNKKYLKINKKEIQGIDTKCFDKKGQVLTDEMGKKVHSIIEKYLDTDIFDESILSKDEAYYIKYQVDIVKKYLIKRGMNVFKSEKEVQYGYKKYIDLLSYNEETKECIIVDWKFSAHTPEHKFKYEEMHYIHQINATMSHFDQKYKVSMLIIPLKNVRNLRLIEFNKEEIELMQKDQEFDKNFQSQKVYYIREKIQKKNIHLERCTLIGNQSQLSLQKYARKLREENQQDLIDIFCDLNQSLNFKDQDEITTHKYISQYDQFYIIHAILTSGNKYLYDEPLNYYNHWQINEQITNL